MRRSSTMASTSDCHSDDVGSIPICGSIKKYNMSETLLEVSKMAGLFLFL